MIRTNCFTSASKVSISSSKRSRWVASIWSRRASSLFDAHVPVVPRAGLDCATCAASTFDNVSRGPLRLRRWSNLRLYQSFLAIQGFKTFLRTLK